MIFLIEIDRQNKSNRFNTSGYNFILLHNFLFIFQFIVDTLYIYIYNKLENLNLIIHTYL